MMAIIFICACFVEDLGIVVKCRLYLIQLLQGLQQNMHLYVYMYITAWSILRKYFFVPIFYVSAFCFEIVDCIIIYFFTAHQSWTRIECVCS